MKRSSYFLILVVLGLIFSGSVLFGQGRGGGIEKITICHMPGKPDATIITVSIAALPAHLAHEDCLVCPCNRGGDNGD